LRSESLVGDEHLSHQVSTWVSITFLRTHVNDLGVVQRHVSIHVKMGFLEISLEGIAIDHFILKLELLFSIIKTLLSLLTIQHKLILLSLDGGLMLCFEQFLLLSEFIRLILKADNILINLNFFLSLQKIYILFLLPDLVRDIRLQF
jgi:hypothetical protein